MQTFIRTLDNQLRGGRNVLPSNCVSIKTHALLLTHDDKKEGKTIFIGHNSVSNLYRQEKCFTIKNPNNLEISLWAMDGCYVAPGSRLCVDYPRKCDAVLGFTNCIFFVEFKTDASADASPEAIKQNREDAVEQITHTICYLKQVLGINTKFLIRGYTIEAYIVTPLKYPNRGTAITNLALKLLINYGVKLYEQNEKVVA